MDRSVRIAIPGVAYHVTQRGHQRRAVTFEDRERRLCLANLTIRAGQRRPAVTPGDESFVEANKARRRRTVGARCGRKSKQAEVDQNRLELFW